jgi:5-formyltetrahydrofolate cyclo-ligase
MRSVPEEPPRSRPPRPALAPSHEAILRARVKSELRKRMRGLRAALPASACAERSSRIVTRLLDLDELARARAVALFWPLESRREVDLRPLDAALRGRGARVAYPAVDHDGRAMAFRFVDDLAQLTEADALPGVGLREPSADAPLAARGELEVIVVPALAVDPAGHRIGYGGGYYDATLPRFVPPAIAVAVAFDFQLLAEAPVTDGDVPVGWIVTDARTLRAE